MAEQVKDAVTTENVTQPTTRRANTLSVNDLMAEALPTTEEKKQKLEKVRIVKAVDFWFGGVHYSFSEQSVESVPKEVKMSLMRQSALGPL